MNPYLTARGALGQRSSGHAVDRKSSTKSSSGSSERVSERVSARGSPLDKWRSVAPAICR